MTTIAEACAAVLSTADPRAKVRAARRTAREWRAGRLVLDFAAPMPESPARPARPEFLPPARMARRGRAGSEAGRIAMLHAVAHIEFSAIDLAFDVAGRFGGQFPRAFVDDWMRVGADEAMHFALLDRRLRALGSHYGALPAHDGLWQAAGATRHDALARLAVVPMVLEARGLDVTPAMVERFARGGDGTSARILTRILNDEIRHVGTGVRWFGFVCAAQRFEPAVTWHKMVREHFGGSLKPPFNDSARASAGLTKEYYAALAAGEQA
ncbi:ferritin-like domain-containing protein [Sphingomonas naphthae]|uniref:Ferritin-like domain-containing protein n=1 Tax=Sphingomonas naphthae TaxID=1813468 RepID=A0ABY7TJH7_9SPHN|nr:ferritin-like domain-containing protein [Sphingomonas naphthae]WCT73372.1 ferritin-like domain-containing protein [Sphingomonas naphthae]